MEKSQPYIMTKANDIFSGFGKSNQPTIIEEEVDQEDQEDVDVVVTENNDNPPLSSGTENTNDIATSSQTQTETSVEEPFANINNMESCWKGIKVKK